MNDSTLLKMWSGSGKAHLLTGVSFLVVLAIAVISAMGGAQAAGTEQHRTLQSDDGDRILLAANDAYAADKAQKDSEAAKPAKK